MPVNSSSGGSSMSASATDTTELMPPTRIAYQIACAGVPAASPMPHSASAYAPAVTRIE